MMFMATARGWHRAGTAVVILSRAALPRKAVMPF